MVSIYATRVGLMKSAQEIEAMTEQVPEWRRAAAQRLRVPEDKIRCLCAYLLAAYAVSHRSGCPAADIQMTRGEFGKPELVFPEGLFFNLSHAGEFVACAVSEKPVGIDIERIKPIDMGIAHRFFDPEEARYLMDMPEARRLDAFYETWTFKESYLKAVGTGFHRPLGSFGVCRGEKIRVRDSRPQEFDWELHRLFVDDGYAFAVTAAEPIDTVELVDEVALYLCK